MCGRFSLIHSADEIEALFELQEMERHEPRYNIAPTQPVLVVIAGDGTGREPGSNLPDRRVRLVRWGLIPSWVKDPRDFPLLINARSETAAEKASFRGPMRHWRVLIPASGFYEWKREGRQKPQAYWVRPRDGSLIAFAGVMDSLLAADGSQVETAAVLTTKANAALSHIHHRMPVVIRPRDFSRWLDCRNFEPRHIAELLAPVDPDFFEAVPVSDKVNKAANMGRDLQEPIELSDDGSQNSARSADTDTQMSLF
ncbi:SOS response-associated peptidase [Hoeflea prorocentri]|uniref:Abasic site processing protein n=1 Tax=Hoeflea prorocentri TaxID=1922333 RepID=A0A9X3UJ91_9HYPH|nr:SOS response-associated peptidase [Hoeflea prorocentri]MCY6381440.1 SOS response-associated peptidase [Hoeflea prorocentri]MDA5399240.1 SOS response-associated peptidase [Hoeflea prorocentri]